MHEHMPLVIELKVKGANVYCYFHNGAVTDNAICYGNALIELFQQEGYENSSLEPEIIGYELFNKLRQLCPFGAGVAMAGLCEESYEYMSKKYPDYSFNEKSDRYVGFIFMSDIDAFQSIQQREFIPIDSFIIDFDKKYVSFELFRIDNVESYRHSLDTAEFHDPDAVEPEDLPVIDYDFKNIPLNDFKNLYAMLDEQYSFAHYENGNRFIYSKLYS